MMIRRQNSYAPRDEQRTDRCEAQSREPVNKVKKTFCNLFLTLHRIFSSQRNREANLYVMGRPELTGGGSNPYTWVSARNTSH
jgi:hypothetical protein